MTKLLQLALFNLALWKTMKKVFCVLRDNLGHQSLKEISSTLWTAIKSFKSFPLSMTKVSSAHNEKISTHPEKISIPPEKISTPSEKISTPPKKSQALPKNSQPLPKKLLLFLKISQPHRKIFNPQHRKFLNPKKYVNR